MNHGLIKKARFESGFTQIPNITAQNKSLSAKEKGILLCLLSLPDDWRVYKTQLHQFFSDGRDGIISGFDKLIEKGYIATERVHDTSNGQFIGHNYIVSPIPAFTESAPIPDSPIPKNPKPANPIPENTELTKKISTNKKLTNKQNGDLSTDISSVTLPFVEPEFVRAWNAWIEYRSQMRKKLTKISAAAQLKLLSKYDFMTAIEMIEQSIRNQWQGLFELKTQNNGGRQNTRIDGGGTAEQFATRVAQYRELD
jgi:hypothetical protein